MSRIAIFFLLFITPLLAAMLGWLGLATLRTNLMGGFLLLVGIGYILGLGIVYWIRKEQFWKSNLKGPVVQEEKGDLSYWLIIPGMLITFFVSPIEYLFFPYFSTLSNWLKVSGLILVVLGVIIFVWARKALGSSYSGHVSVQVELQLVQSGPYHIIRHPAYLGYLLMSLGISLGYLSLVGLFSIPVFLLPGLIYRIRVEDKLLSRHFGNLFQEYATRTARLFPGIW
jgi:protein-S-isoprenylcysteine O-methyltransferase Ste14